jgi:hypothetical protein
VSVLLGLAAIVTVAGALAAITGRDARVALAGLVVALAVSPFLADPLPTPASLGVRVVSALLGGYLLFVVLRETTVVTRGSLVGLPAETLAAAAAFVIGYGTSGLGSTPLGPVAASATGFALAVISVAPIVRGADIFRLGVALAILVTGAELIRVGLAGTPAPLEQLMTAALTVGLLGTVAVLCANAVAATGGLTLRNERRRSPLFEAHPLTPTAPSSLGRSWRPRRPAAAAGVAKVAAPVVTAPVARQAPSAAAVDIVPASNEPEDAEAATEVTLEDMRSAAGVPRDVDDSIWATGPEDPGQADGSSEPSES